MSFPKVNIDVASGNLQRQIDVADTVPCLLGYKAEVNGNFEIIKVNTLAEAEESGITATACPALHGEIASFYAEIGGKTSLYVVTTSLTTSATLWADTEFRSAIASRDINLIAQCGLEDEVVLELANTLKTTLQNMQKANTPVRVLLDGGSADLTDTGTKPSTIGNGFVSIVIGSTSSEEATNMAVGLVLGRATAYAAHIKLGSGKNGALSANHLYLQGQELSEISSKIETLHDNGYLTFYKRPGVAGYFIGRDNTCTDDDFRILAHGRVMDKAQRITAKAYTPFIEDYLNLESDGSISKTDTSYMETVLEQAINTNMGEQISGVAVEIDTNQDIINTSELAVDVKVLPLGYMTWINVTMGLTTQLND